MDSIEIMLKEYEMLREEVLAAMSSRNSILSFGLATIGVLFTASIAIYGASADLILPSLVLISAVPTITISVLFMWLGEYQRKQRVGKFLAGLEARINAEAGKELLTWETHLREQLRHMKYPYITTIMLLTVISVISLIMGFVTLTIGLVRLGMSTISMGLFTLELSTTLIGILVISVIAVMLHVVICKYAVSSISKLQS